jgi:hypothetical protein
MTLSSLLVLASVACQPVEPLGCGAIAEAAFSTFPSAEANPSAIRAWINANYPYTTVGSAVAEFGDVAGQFHYVWTHDQKRYEAQVYSGGAGFNADWLGRKPTLKEVIDCLGRPDSYEAYAVEGPVSAVYFAIWYPARHLYLFTDQTTTQLVVNDGTTFDRLSVPRPDILPTMRLRPWPTDLNDLVVDPLRK